jgi:hypothetical protein
MESGEHHIIERLKSLVITAMSLTDAETLDSFKTVDDMKKQ